MNSKKVAIVGGGVAGLEAALALRALAPGRLAVEIFDPRDEFHYRPYAVGAPYGAARVTRYRLSELTKRCGVGLRRQSIVAVDRDRGWVRGRDGDEFDFDFVVLAVAARTLVSFPGATTFWGVDDDAGIGTVVRELRLGELRRVIFTMPGGVGWGLPLYELALMAAAEQRRQGQNATRITVVTPEEGPLLLFGHRVGEQMAGLLAERGIEVITDATPVSFEAGRLTTIPAGEIEADAVVSLPRIEGRRIAGLPYDAEGFLPVDEHCRVIGTERIFAAGDVTSFPVKQGGIATQQADTAARAIAAAAGAPVEPRPFEPILRAVLWTGEEPRYLYGRLAGGYGDSSSLDLHSPWPEVEGKIIGHYLTPFLEEVEKGLGKGNDS